MRRLALIFAALILAAPAAAQYVPLSKGAIQVDSAPTGACVATAPMQIVKSTGATCYCNSLTWACVSNGGSATFDGLTSGTNTTATMTVGNGASIVTSGTEPNVGKNTANRVRSGPFASCADGTQGRIGVLSSAAPLRYCDGQSGSSTTLRYAAYGDSAGKASSATTADTATSATTATTATVATGLADALSLRPAILRVHWGLYRGAWYVDDNAGDTEGAAQRCYPNSAASAGATSITMSDTTIAAGNLHAGQLVVFKATDGGFYTGSIASLVADTSITLREPLEVGIGAGSNVCAFYNNSSHPTQDGYDAIADDAVRRLTVGDSRDNTSRLHNRNAWAPNEDQDVIVWDDLYTERADKMTVVGTGSPTLSEANSGTVSQTTPSTGTHSAVQVNTGATGDGVNFKLIRLLGGYYKVTALVNAGPDSANSLNMDILANGAAVFSQRVYSSNTPWPYGNYVREVVAYFGANEADAIQIGMSQTGSTFPSSFQIGSLRVTRLGLTKQNLNGGVHVLYGDSWCAAATAEAHLAARLAVDLPNATFYNECVGGRSATDLNSNFDAEVPRRNPDFVWVMIGTNDSISYTTENYSRNLQATIAKIIAIGAKPIVWEPSVGPKYYTAKSALEVTGVSRENARALNRIGRWDSQSFIPICGATTLTTVAISAGVSDLGGYATGQTGLTTSMVCACNPRGHFGNGVAYEFCVVGNNGRLDGYFANYTAGSLTPSSAQTIDYCCWDKR